MRLSLVTLAVALHAFRAFSLLALMGARVGVASAVQLEEVKEEGGCRTDEGLGLGLGLKLPERGVVIKLVCAVEARCGVDVAVGVELEPDSSWRRREGVAAAAGVALAETPKKLLKRSPGEVS